MPEDEFDKNSMGLSIASMVLGIVSLVFMCMYGLGTIPGLVGLILGYISFKKREGVKGFLITGIVTSIIGVIIGVIWLVIYIAVMITVMASV